jgi:hypothetical protein
VSEAVLAQLNVLCHFQSPVVGSNNLASYIVLGLTKKKMRQPEDKKMTKSDASEVS